MKLITLSALALAAVVGLTLAGCSGTREATNTTPKPYPFKTCVVGGEQLGSMGPVLSEVKDGYEVKFCCPECKTKFDKMPTRYMKQIKDAFIVLPETRG